MQYLPVRFCKLTVKSTMKMPLILIIMHFKWLSMNVLNSTFSGVFPSIKWNPVFVHTLQGHSVNKKVAQTHEQCNFLKNKKVAI